MSDSGDITTKYAHRPIVRSRGVETTAAEQAYSVLSANQGHELMLDVRLKTGDRVALPYSYLSRIEFDPSAALLLDFTATRLTIRGRNLGPLYNGLLMHKVTWIQESDPMNQADVDTTTLISGVQIDNGS